MSEKMDSKREGSLEAPTRHPIDWQSPEYHDEKDLFDELERVFDICHGCRRCFNLCNAFPTLFDAVDESESMELDTVPKTVYWDVVDHCYLCDMCYMSKCPYVPPHEWNVDFPHLMLRAKAQRFNKKGVRKRDKFLSATDTVGKFAGIPVVAQTVNAVNNSELGRKVLEKTMGVHRDARVPPYQSKSLRRQLKSHGSADSKTVTATPETTGKVALFGTCYGNRNEPDLGLDLVAVFEHNNIPVQLVTSEKCCGMPKLELGDLEGVAKLKAHNIPELAAMVDQGFDIVAPIPSCVLMFKQELPLMFPEDEAVKKVQRAIFDPFEYLIYRHRENLLNTEFKRSLGDISYHVACHLRVQNVGLKTRDVLQLIPDTKVMPIERCAGHDGTYAVKQEFYDTAVKIAKPVVRKIDSAKPDFYASDCAMAGHHLHNTMGGDKAPTHPMKLLRMAYGI